MKQPMTKPVIKMMPQKELQFDHENPRLKGFGIQPKTPEKEIIELLWRHMAVDEVAMSIAANGFFPHEPLIVAKENGKWVVIEGNRRLAAVRALNSAELRKELAGDLEISDNALETIQELPVIESTREESWRFLGFRHVNGPARWGSYAKAAYIAHVHQKYEVPLEDIATQIGDRHRTVQRLFRALMVLEQADREKVYKLGSQTKKTLPFSHLYTGLDYEGFQDFLDLSGEETESQSPVPEDRLKNLGEVLIWLFGDTRKGQEKEPVIRSQNPDLRDLDKVLRSREACHALRTGSSLKDAVVFASPADARLEEALLEAKKHLSNARGLISDAYKGQESLLKIAGSVANLADDLYQEMESKAGKSKPRRLSAD
ncbi:MAG: ParB/RepB/Spo0J family partition protein [Prosthecobacter sp.]|uniref:ParB/RepB/Spo0J family partition protein n=1 Tax=Prosthecobacter sp. TaxID=1965333 RepID=UPI003BAF440E